MDANKSIQEIMEELWDEFSYYVDDRLDSLEYVSGKNVITENDFKQLVKKFSKLLSQNQSKFKSHG